MRKYWKYILKGTFWIMLVLVGVTLLYRLENDGSREEKSQRENYLSRRLSQEEIFMWILRWDLIIKYEWADMYN